MRKILDIICLFFLISGIVYSQDTEERDPFGDIFSKLIVDEVIVEELNDINEIPEVPLPEFEIQGVLWGTDKPQTIIEGKVYNIGDKIEEFDLKILKIEDNNVFFLYGEKVYEQKVKKRR